MEVYKSLMQATFNHLKDNDRVLINRGIKEKRKIFLPLQRNILVL
jgi:hypothetical protein